MNRLSSVEIDSGNVRYQYDGDGLIRKRIRGSDLDTYAYDREGRLITERRADGARIRYFHDDGGLAAMSSSGRVWFYHYNHRGDVQRLTDEAGNTAAVYRYSPWGEIVATGDAAVLALNRFTFNGRDGVQLDPDTGLYWMHARWYDPQQARFLSTDPEPGRDGSADTAYGYAGNDPVNNTDADGLITCSMSHIKREHRSRRCRDRRRFIGPNGNRWRKSVFLAKDNLDAFIRELANNCASRRTGNNKWVKKSAPYDDRWIVECKHQGIVGINPRPTCRKGRDRRTRCMRYIVDGLKAGSPPPTVVSAFPIPCSWIGGKGGTEGDV